MTAANIAKGMGQEKFKINYLYSELLERHIFPECCPMGGLTMKNFEKDHIVREYLDGIDYDDSDHFKEESHQLYPESRTAGDQRVNKII